MDSVWRYVVHVRNTHNGPSSIHIDDVRVYGMNTATYLACDTANGGYRYGFGAQEKESDISGVKGGHLTYEYRIHDGRLGRFLSVDPLGREFPWNSPYTFAENDVIRCIDLEGREKVEVNGNKIKFSMWYAVFKNDQGVISNLSTFQDVASKVAESVGGRYEILDDLNVVENDGSEMALKAGVYEVAFDIKILEIESTYEEFVANNPLFDDPAYSGNMAYDNFFKFGEMRTIPQDDPNEIGKTVSLRNSPPSTLILYPSSLFKSAKDNKLILLQNVMSHEILIHDLGASHDIGVYQGGVGNKAGSTEINKLNNEEFNNLLKHSEKINTIKNTLINDGVEK